MDLKTVVITLVTSAMLISNNVVQADDEWGTEFETFLTDNPQTLSNDGEKKVFFETEGYIRLKVSSNQIRDDSKFNPDNIILGVQDYDLEMETALTVSDYLDRDKSLRWLITSYSNLVNKIDSTQSLNDLVRFDEVFVDWKRGNLFFSAGKRRINWGHAMAFNPVNIIVPPRNPMEPSNETQGQPALWASVSVPSGSIDLVATRDYDATWSSDLYRWGVRLNVDLGIMDIAGYYFNGQTKASQAFARMMGLSFSSNLMSGMTLYGEAAGFNHNDRGYYNDIGERQLKDEIYIQAVIGSYLLMDPESIFSFWNGDASLLIEVFYNGQGYTENERENYFTNMQPGPAMLSMISDYRFTAMNQLYYLVTYRNSFWEKYALELSAIVAQDFSYALATSLQMDITDYYQMRVKAYFNGGNENSEFGNVPTLNTIELLLEINF